MNEDYKLAVKIRAVEEAFLDSFSKGLLNGTVHTCIGQELSAVAICKYLNKDDYVFSNHRCHGHYIAFTNTYRELIAELFGKETGVCGGIGGSQHLSNKNFFSNGPQGALSPVSVGVANAIKRENKEKLSVCFIGDGTLGEGIIYESMNLASLLKLPMLFVCENNQYAQSTHISKNLSGSIKQRAESFGLNVHTANTWDYSELQDLAKDAIREVRENKPSFLLIDTYRLKAHSKGDDDRDISEIEHYEKIDLLNQSLNDGGPLKDYYKKIKSEIDSYINSITNFPELSYESYDSKNKKDIEELKWNSVDTKINEKQVNIINSYFDNAIKNNDKNILIGEDIADPYGGAFKVTKGLSEKYPDNVISTPISEAAIVGLGIGLSLIGYNPFVEIMFGDFISYSFDQILSNASKFYHMYNKQIKVPLVIRTPMGGGRGYGPTHSQSIEKLFNGINNIQIIHLNTLISAKDIYESVEKHEHTSIIIENKLDYGRLKNNLPESINYNFFKSNNDYPIIIGSPIDEENTSIGIVTFGGAVHKVIGAIEEIFFEYELLPKIVVLTKLYPLQKEMLYEVLNDLKYIITVEESNVEGGFGSEIISTLVEKAEFRNKTFCRIGSKNIPIPSTKSLEDKILVSSEMIIKKLGKIL